MSSDFDFLIGNWKVINTRLSSWLNDCSEWIEFESHHKERKLQNGRGNVALHQYVLDRTQYERSVLRLYQPRWDYWQIDRLDTATSLSMRPLKGTFWSNKGAFLSEGCYASRAVLVWVEWTQVCSNYVCWEQALSGDNGRTWETNWVMEFFRD